jgi:quercetin dioxygenase-like cupin family protein
VADDRVHNNPHTGETITFLKTAADTGGELFQMEIRVEGGRQGFVGPDHHHPHQEERFEVLEGTPRFRLEGREWNAKPGDVVVVPIGASHIFGNAGEGELRMISEYRPALESTERFFEAFFGLAREGKVGADGRPPLLHSTLILHECRDYFVVDSPPPVLQKLLFPVLAGIARLRGYSASSNTPGRGRATSAGG